MNTAKLRRAVAREQKLPDGKIFYIFLQREETFFGKASKEKSRLVDSMLCWEEREPGGFSAAAIWDMGGFHEENFRFFEAFSSSRSRPYVLHELFEDNVL